MRLRWTPPAVAVLVAAGCGGGAGGPAAIDAPPAQAAPARRPNIVFILADDLDVRTTQALPRMGPLLAQTGTSFDHAYVAQSLCTPSRATILTGQFPHNHGVIDNSGPEGGFQTFTRLGRETSTVATWLRAAGYRTGLIGKYMNGYPDLDRPEYIPPGWTEWQAHLSAFPSERYVNYSMNEQGNVTSYGHREEDYETDVISRKAVAFIRRTAEDPSPFFLYVAPDAPHTPAIPPARHISQFRDAEAPRVPSFNESNVQDKPAWVQNTTLLTTQEIKKLDKFQVDRLRTMLAVEDMIGDILAALANTGHLDDTYVFFTSDNGLLLGEHRQNGVKSNGYEESILVPLIVRGPGVAAGRVDDHFVVNVDLAPTFAQLAGVAGPDTMDGRSLVPLLKGASVSDWRIDLLAESPAYTGVTATLRTPQYAYTELESGELELYDMVADPYQLQSLHRTADRSSMNLMSKRLNAMLACRAASCRN